MIWKTVARIKVPDGRVVSLTLSKPPRDKYTFFTIALGPRRQLKCTCGYTYAMRPSETELPEDVDTCRHIKALYGNGSYVVPARRTTFNRDQRILVGDVYLTPLGEELFHHRWAVNALK